MSWARRAQFDDVLRLGFSVGDFGVLHAGGEAGATGEDDMLELGLFDVGTEGCTLLMFRGVSSAERGGCLAIGMTPSKPSSAGLRMKDPGACVAGHEKKLSRFGGVGKWMNG